MAWFNVDDGFWSHPKTLQLSDSAQALWLRAGSWSMKHLTDGFIPEYALPLLKGKPKPINELVTLELWDKTLGGYRFHDWLQYQRSRDQIENDRERNAERQERLRNRKRNGESNGVTNTVTNPVSNNAQSNPIQTNDLIHLNQESSPKSPGEVLTDLDDYPKFRMRKMGLDFDWLNGLIRERLGREVLPGFVAPFAEHILAKAKGGAKNKRAYIEASFRDSPFELQQLIDDRGWSA